MCSVYAMHNPLGMLPKVKIVPKTNGLTICGAPFTKLAILFQIFL